MCFESSAAGEAGLEKDWSSGSGFKSLQYKTGLGQVQALTA